MAGVDYLLRIKNARRTGQLFELRSVVSRTLFEEWQEFRKEYGARAALKWFSRAEKAIILAEHRARLRELNREKAHLKVKLIRARRRRAQHHRRVPILKIPVAYCSVPRRRRRQSLARLRQAARGDPDHHNPFNAENPAIPSRRAPAFPCRNAPVSSGFIPRIFPRVNTAVCALHFGERKWPKTSMLS